MPTCEVLHLQIAALTEKVDQLIAKYDTTVMICLNHLLEDRKSDDSVEIDFGE